MGDRLKPLDFVWARWQICVPDANRVCAMSLLFFCCYLLSEWEGGVVFSTTCAPALRHGSHSCAVDASPPDGAQRSCDKLRCQEGSVGQEIVKSHSADARSRGFHRTSLDGAPQFVMYVLDVQCLALSVVPLADSRFMHRVCL